jgi:hypothetical protein
MYTYKFRLLCDEVEDFVRDFEILAEQTFKDFHEVILENINGLDKNELASFYLCDSRWEKMMEITLLDMQDDEETDATSFIPKVAMSKAVLSDFIDDPHQRLIYEYDFLNIKTFYIELFKTFESDPRKKYPVCTFSSGKFSEPVVLSDVDVVPDDQEMPDDDTEDYYDEEDFESLNNDIDF